MVEKYSLILENKDTKIIDHRDKKKLNHSVEAVDNIASTLAEKLNAPEYTKAFCKYAWYIPQHVLYDLADIAIRNGRNPRAYFNSSVQRLLNKSESGV